MAQAIIEDHGDAALVRLDNGVTNAIGPAMLEDLFEALDGIKEGYRGLVLAGGAKFFSMGFDLPRLLPLDRAGMSSFFYRFNTVVLKLYTLPIPTICAASGHVIAGGTILALTCDYRYAVAEEKKIGLNEIKLGLPVPYLADLMLRQIVGDRAATPLLYDGVFIATGQAHGIGLIDETFPADMLESQALAKAAELAQYLSPAFAEIKANRVEMVSERYERQAKAKNKAFLACWFSPEVQRLLKQAAEKF
ncbi:MAG: enoyl-CoA hydratase/isomerase family protein [Desulfobacteraceae bacterium]|jgi:enoyl-CoA hydratase/carnithine racemase